MIKRATPSKATKMIKVLLEEQTFNDLFKDNTDYVVIERPFEEGYNSFDKIITIKKK